MSDETQQPLPGPAPRRHRKLGALGRVAFGFFGPPARETSTQPVVHRPDSLEKEIDDQLGSIVVETDEDGHHYGVRKAEPKPHTPNPGVVYPYYSGRPPLNAPET